MKQIVLISAATLFLLMPARADLTIVQKIQGGGPVDDMTIEIKGTKSRIQAGGTATIVDAQSGEAITVLAAEKKIVRLSPANAKVAADMIAKFAGTKAPPEKPKVVATGRKETINGMPTEVYTADTRLGKATYYVAENYPDGAAILQQLQQMQPSAFANAANFMPDYRDFKGIPIRTEVDIMGQHIISTVISIKRDPLPEADFVPPQGFDEVKIPGLPGDKLNVQSPRISKPTTSATAQP